MRSKKVYFRICILELREGVFAFQPTGLAIGIVENAAQLDILSHMCPPPSTTRPTWFRTRYPLPAIRLGRASKASIAALLATYLLRDRAFSPLGARLS